MCGIAGFANTSLILAPDGHESVLNSMLNRIHHRGPDEMGLYLNGACCMGNVRLSIVDLAHGQQPLRNKIGNLWIAYNGEVYNHVELREQLIKKGHTFRTNCDTEVVLHMFDEYGSDCLKQLNGQFAFSIWDELSETLFMARDRVGIRPLYYTQFQDAIIYGSEIKSIFEFPGIVRAIDAKALKQVFTFWTSLSPSTIFENIHEVAPGHFLTFSKGQVKVERYWENDFTRNKFKGSLDEGIEEFKGLLTDSVKLRLRADVQVAAYLSGGLDSSVTTSFVNQIRPDVLNTFSIGFQNKDFDESAYQKEVADYFGTRHHSVSCGDADIPELLEQAVWHAETPLMRTSPIPMMLLSKLVRNNGIKVVLTGEGADENLGGYNIFKEALIRQFWAKYPDSKIRPLLLKKLYPYIPQLRNATPAMLRMFFGYKLNETDSPVYSHLLRWRNGLNLSGHFSEELKEQVNGYNPIEAYSDKIANKIESYSTLEKAQYIESNVFMSGYLLSSQGDRVGMANSIEGRYPFLDHRLIEFCASLPNDFKLHGMNEKYIMKRMMNGKLPDSVVNRPKQAYRAPIAPAFLTYGRPLIDKYMNPVVIQEAGLFNPDTVKLLLQKLESGKTVSEYDNMAFIGILSTQILYRQYIQDFDLDKRSNIKGVIRNK